MKYYRFSPIKTQKELFRAIRHVHFECHRLCKESFGKYLPNAGNLGIFCHYEKEYETLIKIRNVLAEPSNNPNQKYFKLYKPITIPAAKDVPRTTYTFLYIRKPDPYRHHVGDIDFYLEPAKYHQLKKALSTGRQIKGARIFERIDLDMIELYDPDVDALAYVSTAKMVETVRTKQSELTKL